MSRGRLDVACLRRARSDAKRRDGGETMDDQSKHSEQSALWNGPGARGWVALQALIDGVYRPFDDRIVDAVASETTQRVLDVGCGTGSTAVAIARRLGAAVRCTGIDISEPMIAAARERARREGVSAAFVVA